MVHYLLHRRVCVYGEGGKKWRCDEEGNVCEVVARKMKSAHMVTQ